MSCNVCSADRQANNCSENKCLILVQIVNILQMFFSDRFFIFISFNCLKFQFFFLFKFVSILNLTKLKIYIITFICFKLYNCDNIKMINNYIINYVGFHALFLKLISNLIFL